MDSRNAYIHEYYYEEEDEVTSPVPHPAIEEDEYDDEEEYDEYDVYYTDDEDLGF